MKAPTQAQTVAFLRGIGNYAAGGGTVMVFSGIKPETAKLIVDSFQQTIDGLTQAVTGLYALVAVLGPILGGVLAWWAAHSASPIQQANSLGNAGAKVLTTPEIAAALPNNPNVISAASVKVMAK